MTYNNMIQVWCINHGVRKESFILLSYLHKQFFPFCIKYKDITNDMPLFFPEKKSIKDCFDNLQDCGIIIFQDDRINAKIEWRHTMIREMFDSVESVIVKKEKQEKKQKIEKEENKDIAEIFKHYNSLGNLKKQKNITEILTRFLEEKLKLHSKEDIIDALNFANEQQWLIDKIDEVWCNCSWIIRNIEGFISGGKYRSREQQKPQSKPTISKYISEGDIII